MNLQIGDKSEAVRTLQMLLIKHGYTITADGDFGPKTEAAVINFQKKNRLYADGVVGPITMSALNGDSVAQSKTSSKFVNVECDKYGGGYDITTLREDAANAIEKVIEELHDYGALFTSSGGKRSLSASVGVNRSKTSMHYTGLAHDLYIYSGMTDPHTDPYVLTPALQPKKWVLWARCTNGGQTLTLDGYTSKHQTVKTTGQFVNATAIFNKYGFSEISSRSTFLNGNDYLGAEWWHFQYETALIKGKSTFGSELLKVYSLSTLEKYSLWNYKDYVYGVNWF